MAQGNAPEIVEGIWGMTYRTELDWGKTIENRVFTADLWICKNDEQLAAASVGTWLLGEGGANYGAFPTLNFAKGYLTRQIRSNRGCGFSNYHFRIIAWNDKFYVHNLNDHNTNTNVVIR